MYELLILLTDLQIKSVAPYEQAIRQVYSDISGGHRPVFKSKGDSVEISFGQFRFYVDISCAPHVLVESKEMAQNYAKAHPARNRIATASCRYELSSDDDPEMKYFNDMVFLTEAANSLPGTFVFDPYAGEFQ